MNSPNSSPTSVAVLKQLFEDAPFRVYAKDPNHIFVYGNKTARESHKVADLVGKTDSEFFAAVYSQEALENERELLAGQCQVVHSHSFERWKDRRLTLVEFYKFPLRDEEGRIVGLWGMSRQLEDAPLTDFPHMMPQLPSKISTNHDSWPGEGYFYRITSTDPGKRLSWFSDSFKKLYGWRSEIPLAANRREMIHPEDRDSVIEELRRAYRGEIEFYRKDFRMKTSGRANRYLWVRSYGRVLCREDNLVHFAGIHRDITDTKDTEIVAQSLLMKFPGYIFAKDSNRKFRYANPSLIADLGLSNLMGIVGMRDEDFFPPKEVKAFKEADDQIIRGDQLEVFRKEKVTTKEKTEDFYTVKFPIPGGIYSMGDRPGVLGFATKSSAILEDLEHKRLLWEALMLDTSDVVFFKNSQGCYLEVNRAFEQLFGVRRQVIARNHPHTREVLKRLDPKLLKKILAEDQFIVDKGRALHPRGSVRHVKVDGKLRVHLSRKLPVFDANGKVKGILGIARDITSIEGLRGAKEELTKFRSDAHVVFKHVDSNLLPFLRRQSKGGNSGKLERRNLGVIFCDIRGFSAFCEELGPDLNALHVFLRDYYSMVVRVAHEHEAIVDKFIGDGALLLVGLVGQDRSRAPECSEMITLSIMLCREFTEMFEAWTLDRDEVPEAKRFLLRLGVGMHHGPVLVGNIKGQKRDQYTAIGPTVNLAQRIERRSGGIISVEEREQIGARLRASDSDLQLLERTKYRDAVLASQAVYRLLGKNSETREKLRPNPCLIDPKGAAGVIPVYGVSDKVLFARGD